MPTEAGLQVLDLAKCQPPTLHRLRLALLLPIWALASFPDAALAGTTWFTTAIGTGTGTSSNDPKTFSVAYITNNLLGPTGDLEVNINLLPSATPYVIDSVLTTYHTTDLQLLKVRIIGQGTKSEDVVLRNDVPKTTGGYPNPDYMVFITGVAETTIKNLVFDGNWAWKISQVSHPVFAQTYKNQPINLSAMNGALSSVIVRNFGAGGVVPFHRFSDSAGTEAFPVVVGGIDLGQGSIDGRTYPWEVEDCEIHGFTGTYGGYATFLMAHGQVTADTPYLVKTDSTRRFISVRRCQLRGVPGGVGVIGFGNAANPPFLESGRTIFSDNIIVNAFDGYNVDTGQNRYVDIIDSLGCNVVWWARIESRYLNPIDNYRIAGNAVRLGPLSQQPTYRSFCNSAAGPISDPSLILGRPTTNLVSTALSLGSVGNITFDNNWISTVPFAQFFTPVPGDVPRSVFNVIQKWPSQVMNCDNPGYQYYDGSNYTIGVNSLSATAWDFTSLIP